MKEALESKKSNMKEDVHLNDFHAGTRFMVRTTEMLSDDPTLYRSLGVSDRTPEQMKIAKTVEKRFKAYQIRINLILGQHSHFRSKPQKSKYLYTSCIYLLYIQNGHI